MTPETPQERPKRILFVAGQDRYFVTHRLPLALAARAHGYDVHVATPEGRSVDDIRTHGIPWHPIVMRRSSTNLVREAWAIGDLMSLYRRVRPDLVHHIAIKAVLYGTIAARTTHVPAVVNAVAGLGYALDEPRRRTAAGRAISFAFSHLLRHPRMRMIFQNDVDRDLFIRRGWIDRGRAVVIHGAGVDTDVFTPADGPPVGTPLVVLASRLLRSKGVAEFADAARIVRRGGVNARFAIVGEPDPDNPDTITREQLDAWAQEGPVETWGMRRDMPAVLRQASLFALPTYYREGVPKALIEAAAAGLPAITTDTPGCRDIVSHDETGLLVPPRDARALAAAIEMLLGDPARRAEMGRKARARVLLRFSLRRVVDATLATFDELSGASDSRREMV
jgi:glycosyltransferase involved in cell wall biosynthesis